MQKKFDQKPNYDGLLSGIPLAIKDLSNIFKFIEKLNKANTDNVKPLSSILDHSLRSREDKVNDGNIRDQILENAPNKNEDFFIVPKVIE